MAKGHEHTGFVGAVGVVGEPLRLGPCRCFVGIGAKDRADPPGDVIGWLGQIRDTRDVRLTIQRQQLATEPL